MQPLLPSGGADAAPPPAPAQPDAGPPSQLRRSGSTTCASRPSSISRRLLASLVGLASLGDASDSLRCCRANSSNRTSRHASTTGEGGDARRRRPIPRHDAEAIRKLHRMRRGRRRPKGSDGGESIPPSHAVQEETARRAPTCDPPSRAHLKNGCATRMASLAAALLTHVRRVRSFRCSPPPCPRAARSFLRCAPPEDDRKERRSSTTGEEGDVRRRDAQSSSTLTAIMCCLPSPMTPAIVWISGSTCFM
jgi:hypothetical protein